MAVRCVILDDYQDVATGLAEWDRLAGSVSITRQERHLEGEDLVDALSGSEIVVAMRERTVFSDDLLARLPKLKLLVTTGMKNASIDMSAARRRGVVVCGTGSSAGAAAELAWGLLLGLMRSLPDESANFRSGGERWQLSLGRELKGKTLGVVGLGKLGQLVAGYGKAFGMEVLGWSKHNSPERSAGLGIGFAATLEELLARADVVSLHVTLNDETRGLIDAHGLGLMKRDAVIVNTSRGPLIDEEALIAALEGGRIGGGALDVYDREPLPADHPFRRLPNVIATPHLGYVTRETYSIYFREALEDIERWLAGDPIRVINGEDTKDGS
ncbi:D-2-hydroxyacid dehydrogenase family protein [Faunimonas pinastri]|nr:D-2-hydroxyacid dehydrogenase family protein [Faunimonas pinastri]